MTVKYQGDDIPINLTITNPPTGEAIDIDSLSGIIVYLVHGDSKVVAKYSLNSITDFESIEVIDAPNGKIKVVRNSSQSVTDPEGNYSIETRVSISDSSDDDHFFSGNRNDNIYQLRLLKSKNQTTIGS